MMLIFIFLSYLFGIFAIFLLKDRKYQQTIALGTSGFSLLGSTDIFVNYDKVVVDFSELISIFDSSSIFLYFSII